MLFKSVFKEETPTELHSLILPIYKEGIFTSLFRTVLIKLFREAIMAMEYFINNLSKEILFECKKSDIECHSNFILYYLRLLALDPIWNLFPDMNEIFRIDALRLIKFVVKKMTYQQCPCIVTMKMQLYFTCNFEDKATIAATERTNFKNRLKPLEDEICETLTEEKADIIFLRKKIIYYITLWRGLGNPTKTEVFREARQALYSIYDDNDVVAFMKKTAEEKELELFQLAQICSGIRLFNWSCKKGGEGIEDVPLLAKNAIVTITDQVQVCLVDTMDKVNILTTVVDCMFIIITHEVEDEDMPGVKTKEYTIQCHPPRGVNYEDIEFAKDMLIVFRQLELMNRKLIQEVDNIQNNINELDIKFQEVLEHFHSLVYLKVGIPTDVVFPIFIELDKIWEDYQNEIIYLVKLGQILSHLQLYDKDLMLNMEVIKVILGDQEILTDGDRLAVESDIELEIFSPDISIISATEEVKLEFLGFCPWKLVETQGGLLPGNPNLGVIVYKGKYYIFSCIEGIHEFDKAPAQLINEALELVRKKTELIPMLQLEEQLAEVQTVKELVIEQKEVQDKVVQADACVQTTLHPVETKIDQQYMWNVWDWKRQAICLANISKRQSKSTQTESSSNKNAVTVQTYETRQKMCQTKKDNYTNVSTPQTYFFGLRGRKDDRQFILDLTRPVDN